LFEPFFTTKKNGLGLGLNICRTIVEGHGGRLVAENGTTGGAVFSVYLPVSE
jgi:C4-dicarboxylate-specific signal transduction histidine kinase